jgi:hypothetical protein
MFLAAESLEETAAAGRFLSPEGADAAAVAERYSYEWRHGMAGGWPLYVPGFFAVAIATVLWSRRRSIRGVVVQGAPALLFALLVAKLLAPHGTNWLLPSYERDAGLALVGSPVGPTWDAALPGVLTLVSWVALVVALQTCVTRRSIWLLVAPLVCYSVLAALRPGDFGDLVRPWAGAVLRGESVAIASTALIPLVAAVLWRYCVRFRASRGSTRALRAACSPSGKSGTDIRMSNAA